ncbi:MAG: hypothetical protein DCC75_04630 [Proteobacteria bacterium]|nr:MAG: hypothetical protein DCC75_04630 [Pseudomonadota bacterium]
MKIIPVDPKISPPMAPNLALKLLEHAYRQLGPSNVRRIDLATKALALASIHTLSFPKIFRKELNAMTPPP